MRDTLHDAIAENGRDAFLNPAKTALVVIDMQKGVLNLNCAPHPTIDILDKVVPLVELFRKMGSFVVLVNVDSKDGKDMLQPITDLNGATATTGTERPMDYGQLATELNVQHTDHLITKHQWGAFFGTDLDVQLRRRGIDTIVLCGIATNIGVETTAREAFQHGYQQVFVTDAMTALSEDQHVHTCKYIFPRIGRIRSVANVLRMFQ